MDLSSERRPELNQPSGVLVERLNGGQPILSPTENWWETGVTFNAAAVYLEPSPENQVVIRTLLPMRSPTDPDLAQGVLAIHYRARPEIDPGSKFTRSFIGLALFTPDLKLLYRYREPVLSPSPDPLGFDSLGVEDPRITRIGGIFYMVYCGVESDPLHTWKANLCLASSVDLLHWEKLGVMPGDPAKVNNKDGVLFPDIINGKYFLLHRPFYPGLAQSEYSIHLAASQSILGPWDDYGEIIHAYANPKYLSSWVGGGSVPIQVGKQLYIEIYHTGNFFNSVDREYDLDAALFDFSSFDPSHPASLVMSRLEPLMVPETPAELRSHSQLMVGNTLFACGSYEFNGDIIIIYGGADTYTLAARVNRQNLLESLNASGLANPFIEKKFFHEFFPWQYPANVEESWDIGYVYDKERYWGGFPREFNSATYKLPEWALGPFQKFAHNPILAPGPDEWDAGRFGGGVHNGSIIQKNGLFYYVYRGERAIPPINGIDYLCKIGIAVSSDGIHFEKMREFNPLFGAEDHFSYEDVNLVEHNGLYFLFCNRWDWARFDDPSVSGAWLAVSSDLIHWEERGLLFPAASRIHRNGVVVMNPDNQAVRLNRKFVMYINDFLIAYSDDLYHWESKEVEGRWPGGEGCFALVDYREDDPDALLLFTGGHHSGHFYAIGEVLFSKKQPEIPIDWLPRPVLAASPDIPGENGYSASEPGRRISFFRDCIFFNGLTRHQSQWLAYCGGSEYYTCLASAEVKKLDLTKGNEAQ